MGFAFQERQLVLPNRDNSQSTIFEKGESLSLGVSFLPIFATYTQPFSTICQANLIPLSADRKSEGQGMRFFYALFNPYTYQPANIPHNS